MYFLVVIKEKVVCPIDHFLEDAFFSSFRPWKAGFTVKKRIIYLLYSIYSMFVVNFFLAIIISEVSKGRRWKWFFVFLFFFLTFIHTYKILRILSASSLFFLVQLSWKQHLYQHRHSFFIITSFSKLFFKSWAYASYSSIVWVYSTFFSLHSSPFSVPLDIPVLFL